MKETELEQPIRMRDLSAPHFDDESTIVSARPVVPIDRAKAVERSRMILWLLSITVMAAVLGALAAFGMSYFENRPPGLASPAQSSINREAQANRPAAQPPSSESSIAEQKAPTDGTESTINSPTRPTLAAGTERAPAVSQLHDPKISAPGSQSNLTVDETKTDETSREASRLIRKRRVHSQVDHRDGAASARQGPNARHGAAHIQEIFQGPNP